MAAQVRSGYKAAASWTFLVRNFPGRSYIVLIHLHGLRKCFPMQEMDEELGPVRAQVAYISLLRGDVHGSAAAFSTMLGQPVGTALQAVITNNAVCLRAMQSDSAAKVCLHLCCAVPSGYVLLALQCQQHEACMCYHPPRKLVVNMHVALMLYTASLITMNCLCFSSR